MDNIEMIQGMTKTKKEQVRKIVKAMLEQDNISYDDWLASQELEYMLNNTNVISDSLSKQTKNNQGGSY